MKALLMAAGKGTRISRYIEGKPKCTVDIGEIPLIEYTIQELMKRGVTEIALVLGYHADDIKEILGKYDIKYYYNYFYDVTNSIASLWFAQDFVDDDMIFMNADVYLEPALLDEVFKMQESPVLVSDSSRKEQADYKFYYEDGQLIKFGKQLEGDDISGEYVGVARVRKDFLPVMMERLQELIEKGEHHRWWEDVLYSFVGEQPIKVRDIDGMFWAEVDYVDDYERILQSRGYEINYNVSIRKTMQVI